MTSSLAYKIGMSIGKLIVMVEKSVLENRGDNVEALKIKYTFVMEILFDLMEDLENSRVSEVSQQDLSDELDRLIDKYGEIYLIADSFPLSSLSPPPSPFKMPIKKTI